MNSRETGSSLTPIGARETFSPSAGDSISSIVRPDRRPAADACSPARSQTATSSPDLPVAALHLRLVRVDLVGGRDQKRLARAGRPPASSSQGRAGVGERAEPRLRDSHLRRVPAPPEQALPPRSAPTPCSRAIPLHHLAVLGDLLVLHRQVEHAHPGPPLVESVAVEARRWARVAGPRGLRQALGAEQRGYLPLVCRLDAPLLLNRLDPELVDEDHDRPRGSAPPRRGR